MHTLTYTYIYGYVYFSNINLITGIYTFTSRVYIRIYTFVMRVCILVYKCMHAHTFWYSQRNGYTYSQIPTNGYVYAYKQCTGIYTLRINENTGIYTNSTIITIIELQRQYGYIRVRRSCDYLHYYALA